MSNNIERGIHEEINYREHRIHDAHFFGVFLDTSSNIVRTENNFFHSFEFFVNNKIDDIENLSRLIVQSGVQNVRKIRQL